ncbi:MAG: hypothetical protein GEU88_10535 [Solirubrobacterales bacterium]|nr:hypothetical protein [Solirubrobacterales bacterium]
MSGEAPRAGVGDSAFGFAVGDAVVARRHGVGRIVERTRRDLAGARCDFLTVEVERRGVTIFIPVGLAAGGRLRRLATPEEARRALAALSGAPQPLPDGWRERQKEAARRLGLGKCCASPSWSGTSPMQPRRGGRRRPTASTTRWHGSYWRTSSARPSA